MMELGSGIALGSLCIAAGAVAITAIRASSNANVTIGKNGKNGMQSPCKEHSGIVACLDNIEKNQDRQEKWLQEISMDVKEILRK